MSLAINNFAGVTQASDELDSAVRSYNEALEAILQTVKGTTAVWEGSDADSFRSKAIKAIGEEGTTETNSLRKVGEVMASHAVTLRSISDALTKTSQNIKNSMGQ